MGQLTVTSHIPSILPPSPCQSRPPSEGGIDDKVEVVSGLDGPKYSVPAPVIPLTPTHIQHLNAQLEPLEPFEILRLCRIFFPSLYQSTALGMTGLVILDMLSRLDAEPLSPVPSPTPVIFIDTLHHFPETYDLLRRIQARHPTVPFHIIHPSSDPSSPSSPSSPHLTTPEAFATRYGPNLWASHPDLYDYLAKVEPQYRALRTLIPRPAALLTGRRRSQGGQRAGLPIIEVVTPPGGDADAGAQPIIKINPLARWSFAQVQAYIREHDVLYNALLDQGYRSVGDWHSTSPVGEGEDERAGRWRGQEKTECGIHNRPGGVVVGK